MFRTLFFFFEEGGGGIFLYDPNSKEGVGV